MELAKNGSEKSNGMYDTMAHFGGSLLRFDQNQTPFATNINQDDDDHHDYLMRWEESSQHSSNLHQNHQLISNSSCTNTNSNMQMQTTSNYASSTNELPFGWLGTDADVDTDVTLDCIQNLDKQESCLSKRPSTGESIQAAKKQCKPITKSLKSKAKDPQSVAAKNRRERISERMKILQDLVPNGSKVDLVTMLEKAISYVKFLQLQVKVLATDEFWPAQGGKAPDISQVKEAIDAILASQRDRNSSSIS